MKRCSDLTALTALLAVLGAAPGCGEEAAPAGGTGGAGGSGSPAAGTGGAAGGGGMPTGGGGSGGMTPGGGGGTGGVRRDGGARAPDAGRRVDGRGVDSGRRDLGGSEVGAGARVVLFDGANLAAWVGGGGGNARWPVVDGTFEILPGSGDIRTRQRFGDMRLHVEFRVPRTPETNGEQDRGNSGVYIQGRYEVQILDSFNHPLSGANDCASIYGVKDADSNEATPPDTWQTFDITFRAARFNGNTKVANARISVIWNGKEVQRDVEIRGPTGSGEAESAAPGPLRLQEHAHRVRFRNLWLEPL